MTREHMAVLRELADDLDDIVKTVTGRDGDATARQHQRAAAVHAAIAALSASQAPCASCNGRGVVGGYEPVHYGIVFGNRAVDIPCPDCHGNGAAPAPEVGTPLDDAIDDLAREAFSELCEGDARHSEALDLALLRKHLHAARRLPSVAHGGEK